MLITAGFVFIVAGFLIEGAKVDQKLKERLKGNRVVENISGNVGIIFFVVGLVLVIAGVVDLYYG